MSYSLPSKIPRVTNKKALLLAESITATPFLERIPVKPQENCIVNNCFYNVKDSVQKYGGEIVYGWQIWDRDLFIEAGFHAIWEKDNERIDITPKDEREILFFEDKSRVFEGYSVDNIRRNFTGNPLVDDFIKVHESLFMIENFGDNRFLHNPTEPVVLRIPEPLVIMRKHLKERIIPELLTYILSGGGQDSICFCGRELQYYSCHHIDIKETYNKLKSEFEKSCR